MLIMKTHRLGLAGLALLSVIGCGSGKIQRGVFEGYPLQYQEGRNGKTDNLSKSNDILKRRRWGIYSVCR